MFICVKKNSIACVGSVCVRVCILCVVAVMVSFYGACGVVAVVVVGVVF